MRNLILALVTLFLATGCATMREASEIPPPRDLHEALLIAQGQVSAVRDVTAIVVNAKGEDCAGAARFTDFCDLAHRIQSKTRDLRDRIDDARTALLLVDSTADCVIEYEGVVIPCEDETDRILAAVIELQNLMGDLK